MTKSICKSVKDITKETQKQRPEVNKFVQASEQFEQLVKEGLATRRGFNIKTLQEIYQPDNNTHFQNLH